MRWLSFFRLMNRRTSTFKEPATWISDDAVATQVDLATDFLPWLLDSPPLKQSPWSSSEQRALNEVEKTLRLPFIPDSLLPRASTLVPQLISLLRETALPLGTIANRVSRDPLLAAEVMRVANSPYYRARGEVTNLVQAIALIGSIGLQTAIARVVLKPIVKSSSTSRLARIETRLWMHAETIAQHAATLAVPSGQQALDGYLSGLLCNTGWKLAFSVIDRAGMRVESPLSDTFAAALSDKAHRLFGLAAKGWNITPGFAEFANDARTHGLAASTHPMARILLAAHQAKNQTDEAQLIFAPQ